MNRYVYKNTECEKKMHDFYDKVIASLNVTYQEKTIKTVYGDTHLLIVGDISKPPIFTLHGGNGINPLNIRLFLRLLDSHCIYAPDVIGMPGKSAPFRNLHPSTDDYGLWIKEILETLEIQKIPFVVSSYSSAMMLPLAKVSPDSIKKAVLLVPSGIAHGAMYPIITKMMIPFMTYAIHPTMERLEKTFAHMLTEKDKLWYEFFDILLTCYKMEMRAPREYKASDLKKFSSPLFIIPATEDIFFPPQKVLSKAKKIFVSPIKEMIISGKHLPSEETMKNISLEIEKFLK